MPRPAIALHRHSRAGAHYAAAADAIARLSADGASPLHRAPPDGHMRGVDFYSGRDLLHAMAFAMLRFQQAHGSFPDLIMPVGTQQKLFWRKFLGHMKVPESGDKLKHTLLMPPSLRRVVAVPDVVWRSATARLPDNAAIEPGWYFLKANHGSRFNAQVRFPCRRRSARGWKASPPAGWKPATACGTASGGTAPFRDASSWSAACREAAPSSPGSS